jgi:uncharacterized protein with HEPN domain
MYDKDIFIAHQYFDISAEAVFETCTTDIPLLAAAIKKIIQC